MRHVLLWGAINARTPDPNVPQVASRPTTPAAGASTGNASYWKTFKNACKPYDGPPLSSTASPHATLQTAATGRCRRGSATCRCAAFAPFRPQQSAFGFNVSHWSGPLAKLDGLAELHVRHAVDGPLRPAHLRRRAGLRLQARPATTRRPTATARYVYIDTFNSVYGAGLEARARILVHCGDGTFCHSFVPQTPSRPVILDSETRAAAPGELERVTGMGPGVRPEVAAERCRASAGGAHVRPARTQEQA